MTTANKITIFRIAMIPLLMVFLTLDVMWARWAALCVFVIAALSDALDGFIARHFNQVTNFGKLMDPLADKILVIAALIAFIDLGEIPSWIVTIIIAREFLVTGLRTIAISNNKVIEANSWGKIKTISQMLAIISIFADRVNDYYAGLYISGVLIYIALASTIISGTVYFVKNWGVINEKA